MIYNLFLEFSRHDSFGVSSRAHFYYYRIIPDLVVERIKTETPADSRSIYDS